MKFALAAILVADVSARHFMHHPGRHHYGEHTCPFAIMKYGRYEEKPVCPNLEGYEHMAHHTFYRKNARSAINAFLQGWFHDNREEMLPEECLGDWMEEKQEAIHEIHHKFFKEGEIWTTSYDDIRTMVNDQMDILFKNNETCKPFRLIYNKYEWCMDNIETCAHLHHDMLPRLMTHGFQIYDLVTKLFYDKNVNDECFSDEMAIEFDKQTAMDFGDLLHTITGFTGTWDPNGDIEERITFKEMKANFHAAKDAAKAKIAAEPFNPMAELAMPMQFAGQMMHLF